MHALRCYRCGASLAKYSLPLSRHDRCPDCVTDLHACRMCRHYDPRVIAACKEDAAEEVHDKLKANFCEFFSPSEDAFAPGNRRAHDAAEAALKSLFGDDTDPAQQPPAAGGETNPTPDDPLQRARSLFKD